MVPTITITNVAGDLHQQRRQDRQGQWHADQEAAAAAGFGLDLDLTGQLADLRLHHVHADTAVVLQSGEQRFCLAVDSVRGREEVVIKALPRTLRGLPGYAGASLIGDGRMALILDVDALYRTGVRGGR